MVRRTSLTTLACIFALGALAAPNALRAQDHEPDHDMSSEHEGQMPGPLLPDLAADVETVRDKLLGLANAIPEELWEWRPGEGVRSVGEVFLHVVADNYFIPMAVGVDVPAWTGIDADDYQTTKAFEERTLTPAQVIAELGDSFEHLAKAMAEVDEHRLGREVMLFGHESTAQEAWILTVTHLHEHLGQMIAYGRVNGIVPPWSM